MPNCDENRPISVIVKAFEACKNKACAWVNGDENARVELGGVMTDSIRALVKKIKALWLNLTYRFEWKPDTQYYQNDVVLLEGDNTYWRCIVDHTSSDDFPSDLDAKRWEPFSATDATKLIYFPDASNSVPRALNARLTDRYSPCDFGATGNGSVDDTEVMQVTEPPKTGPP